MNFSSSLSALLSRIPVRDILRAGYATALRIVSTILMLGFGIVGAELLGAESFGKYVSIFAIAGLAGVATSIGLPALLQREFAASRGSGDRSGLKPLTQGLAVINGLLFAALIGSAVVGSLTLMIVLGFCLISNLSGILGALFSAHERVLLYGWIGNVVGPGVALLSLLGLSIVTTPSYLIPLFAQMIGVIAAVAVLFFLWRGEPLRNSTRAFTVSWWSERHPVIVRSGLIFGGTQLLVNLTTQVDILILTAMATPEDVAHYYAAVRAAFVLNFFFAASGMLAEPTLTRLEAARKSADVQALASRTAITGAVSTVILATIAVFVAPWYLSLYGPSFAVAFFSFCIFSFGIVVRSFFGPAEPMLRATRAENSLMAITAAVLVINVAISVALVPWLGLEGAAIGSALQFITYGVLLARAVRRRGMYRTDVFFLPHKFRGDG